MEMVMTRYAFFRLMRFFVLSRIVVSSGQVKQARSCEHNSRLSTM